MRKVILSLLFLLLVFLLALFILINPDDRYPFPDSRQVSEVDRLISEEFNIQTIALTDSYDGQVVATLISRPADTLSERAVLYIHGYGDYFFQRHLARWYNDQGFNFFALDLRRYGHSWLPHQRPNYVGDLTEYFEEIDRAVEMIREGGGSRFLLLNGHSTGGLTASLYCHMGKRRDEVDALFLNSPFLDFNADWGTEQVIKVMAWLGQWKPTVAVAGGAESVYTKSLHKDFQGRWDFNTNWKPLVSFPVYSGWLNAIERGHQMIERRLDIRCPVLVMHSDKSYFNKAPGEEMLKADAVLDVGEIHSLAPLLGQDVTVAVIPDAVHDIFLSEPGVLLKAYGELDGWLEGIVPD